MKYSFQILGSIFLVILLTAITQIGGIILLLSYLLACAIKAEFRAKVFIIFMLLYLISTSVVVPNIAPIFGREPVKNTQHIKPVNYAYVLLNRNYVTPELNRVLQNTERYLSAINNKVEIRYLDACFPFINGFPLLPHLSHNDGKKIDLSFVYKDRSGISNKQKSVSGYGVFVEPTEKEFNQTVVCKAKGNWLYDYSKFFRFWKINDKLTFSTKGTKALINGLLGNKNVGKIFVERHLKNRMNLKDSRIRFQGCKSVRHDDHIHVQLK